MISEEELELFKKKNITDKTVIELENALRVSISITAKYQEKKKFKSYMLAIRCLQDEIDRLNNIIDELEKWLDKEKENYNLELTKKNEKALSYSLPIKNVYREVLDKLKELKENK